MNAYEIPSLRFSLPAGGAVKRHRFVAVDANSNGIQAGATTSSIIGASMNEASIGQVLEIADGIVMIEAAKTVTAGSLAYASGEGKVTDAGTIVAGIIITSAAAGGLAAVKIK